MIGTTVTHYRILEKVGAGGMGEVYLAEDTKLRRKVAIKVLPEELTRDPDRRRRFVQEARAAAGVEHPHIAAVYDIDEFDGRTFMAMEYVRGQSLRDAISVRRLTPTQAVELAIQVADGLAKVHERGIVHRDLKPENVIVSEEGYAKIIDFGLAKLLEPLFSTAVESSRMVTETRFHTTAGQILGTVAYMSPEQAQGLEVDARSDIFSFGVMLYEMLSGKDPFKRPSAVETLSAILRDTPPPLVLPAAHAPAELQRVLRQALAKAPTERYQRMRDMADDLRALREKMARQGGARVAWRVAVPALALAAALLAGTYWLARRAAPAPAPVHEPVSVLVADFDNRTRDPVFDGALEQTLGLGLEGAPFISAYGRPQARKAAAEVDPAAAGKLDERIAQLVCRSQGVKVLVAGSIEPKSEGYVLKAWALDPVTSNRLAEAARAVPGKGDVLRAADGVAADLRRQLGDTAARSGRGLEGETFTTASLDAMNSYARAQELYPLGKYDEAIAEYRKAIAQDPTFGRAYTGLAVQLANLGQKEEAEKYFQMALARVDQMSEREKHRTIGVYSLSKGNYEKAIEEFRALVKEYPADTAGHGNLALAYFFSGDMKRAYEQGRHGVELYPKNLLQRNNVALYAMYAGDFETAEREARAVLEQNPAFEKAYVAVALSEAARGQVEKAAETYRRLQTISARGVSLATTGLADLALYEGRPAEAASTLEKGIAGDAANRSAGAAAYKAAVLSQAQLMRGQKDPALTAADQAAAGSRQESVLYLAAHAYLEGGQEGKALRLATEIGRRLERPPQAYAKLIEGEAQRGRGRLREAIAVLQDAQKLSDTWLGRFALGRVYLEAGAFAEAYSELDACLKRRGEAAAVFLDDVPSLRFLPPVYYYLGRAQEGLKSPRAVESFKTFLAMKERGDGSDPLVAEARRRLQGR